MRLALLVLFFPVLALGQGYRPSANFQLRTLDIQASLLGHPLSVDSLTLTHAAPGEDAILIREMTYIRLAPSSVNGNAKMRFNPDTGLELSMQLLIAPGGAVFTDYLNSRQGARPVEVSEPYGLAIVCGAEASLGTCGSGTLIEGTMKTLCATASSRTRICTCTASSNTSPVFAWALDGGSGTVGTSTTCPGVTP